MRLFAVWPISLLLGCLTACTVTPPKPYTPQTVDPTAPTYILVGGWLADWGNRNNGDLHEIADQLKREGSAYIVAPVRSKNNQSANAKVILGAFRSIAGPVIIVSGSRGTSEVAQAIAQMTPEEKKRIRMWISISGAQLGSPVAEVYASQPWRYGTALWSAVAGWGPLANIEEMRFKPSRERFRKVEPELRGIPTVSVVTVAKDCTHLAWFKRIGCQIVDAVGLEHDGLILAQDQALPGSLVIEMRGHRHMLNAGYQADVLALAERMVASK